jgi:OmcA/MtrC family decaheme c-type cytochrome
MTKRRSIWCAVLVAAMIAAASREASAQEAPLAWDATQFFTYNIEKILLDRTVTPWRVKVIFSVRNPNPSAANPNPLWNIKTDVPFTFKQPVAGSQPSPSLSIDIGWNTVDYVNTGSRFNLLPVLWSSPGVSPGVPAASPIRINALTAAQPCALPADCEGVIDTSRFWVSSNIPPQTIAGVATGAIGTGVVAIEGHPVWPPSAPTSNVPVKSVFANFPLTDATAVPRRQVVAIEKCKACHDNKIHKGVLIPRLSLHGGNRTEEPGVCVICHNPNQTDVAYRTPQTPPATDPLGAEMSVDFKRLVHGIHAGGFRKNPFVIVGFRGAVTDFSDVRFPAQLRNCTVCHLDANGKGTFELPLKAGVLGSTVKTGSDVGVVIDVDPTNNLRITPIASVCSSCHDGREARSHMTSKGAAFGVLQSNIQPNQERCVQCHGPGQRQDVRRAHEVGRGGSGGGDDD